LVGGRGSGGRGWRERDLDGALHSFAGLGVLGVLHKPRELGR
jgi:hypothetical protein